MRNKSAIDIHSSMKKITEREQEKIVSIITKLRNIFEEPEKYTFEAKISFDHHEYERYKPIPVTLTFSDESIKKAIIDSDYCVEFDVVFNNEVYDVTVAEIDNLNIIFDYKIKNPTAVYALSNEQSLLLEASDEYKMNTKIAFEISGQIGNVERNGQECCLFSFSDELLYKWIIIYDDILKKSIKLKPGMYVKMIVLMHEFSLSVLECEEITKPTNAHAVECFYDYKEI